MKKIPFLRLFLVVLTLVFSLDITAAQERAANIPSAQKSADQGDAEAEKSWFLSFVERQLSGPNRKIHISGISGVLSSQASIGSITIADRQGVWLSIENAQLDWNRLELLRGRVSVNSLSAKRINIVRAPLPDNTASVPTPEATGFSLPELPVAIKVEKLVTGELHFGEALFGLEATVSLDGSVILADGALQSRLDIKRLDGSGGAIVLLADYANKTGKLKLDLDLAEPENGIAANLLKIEGRPPLKLTLKGDGSLDDIDIKLMMDARGQAVLNGGFSLKKDNVGHNFNLALNGPISILMPEIYRPFFGSNTKLALNGVKRMRGGVRLDHLVIDGAAIQVKAMADTTPDGFLRQLVLDARLADENGAALVLPVSGGNTKIKDMVLTVSYGMPGVDAWFGKLVINNLATPGFSAGDVTLDMGGATEHLDDPANRHVVIGAKGGVHHITTASPEVAAALGNQIAINVDMDSSAGKPFSIKTFDIGANGLAIWLKGELEQLIFKGQIGVKADSLAPFSDFAGRDLAGKTDLTISGTIGLASGTLDLGLDGTASGVKTGIDIADRLLKSEVIVAGGIGRDQDGLHARQLKIGNQDVSMSANGSFASQSANMDFGLSLSDLGLLDGQASGGVTVRGALRGHNAFNSIGITAEIADGTLSGRKLESTTLAFNGILDATAQFQTYISGMVNGQGRFDNQPLTLATAFETTKAGLALDNLNLALGNAKLSGSLVHTNNGLLDGAFRLDAADISTLAALALMDGKGAAHADIRFDGVDGKQNVDVQANAQGIDIAGTRIDALDLKAVVSDLFGVPQADGSLDAKTIHAGDFRIDAVKATSTVENGASHFSLNASLQDDMHVQAAGALAPIQDGWRLALEQATMQQRDVTVALARPAQVTLIGNSKVDIRDLMMQVGAGTLAVNGTVDNDINLGVEMTAFPLSIANMVKPELKLGGMASGTAKISGQLKSPLVRFDVNAEHIDAAPLSQNGIAPLNLVAKGDTNGDRLDINARLTGGGGIDVGAKGNVHISKQLLDIDVTLGDMSLNVLNTIIQGQNFAGNISGNAHVSGTFTKPQATFTLGAQGLSNTILTNNGLAPLALTTKGQFGDNIVTVESLELSGPQNLNVKTSGRVPVSGQGLDLKVNGSAPLALVNRFLADRGAQLSGLFNVNATVQGNIANPHFGGNFGIANGQFIDPDSNARLNDITLNGALNGDQITISALSAKSASGGTIAGSGVVSTNFAQGMPANIVIRLAHTRYNDGNMVIATVDGNMTIIGPLLRDFEIGGKLTIENAEISVPDNFGGASQIDVQHKNLTKPIGKTLERAKMDVKPKSKTSAAAIATSETMPKLNMIVQAPNKMFVRGRGLDIELGGGIRITGPVTDVRPVGSFNMVRGRFNILTQRLNFEEGQVTLTGNLNPELLFIANTDGSDIIVTVTVKGTPDDLDIAFTSQPELPQDEVLARLIFNRSIGELSPFQIAQLAAAAAELTGITKTSIMGSLRSATGLDDLDVVTDAQGNTGVKAGRYIRDNIYLGVEAGSDGDTKGTVNLDINRHLKGKGAVGSDGDSSVGIFYEKDY